jgi:sec-independent protein translocase protein TatB
MLFDIAPSEVLLTVIVAVVVIGPKDLPVAMRTAGRWLGKMRRVSGYFRSGIETMIREAELEDMETKWREQNAAIMLAHPPTSEIAPTLLEHAPPTEPTETPEQSLAGAQGSGELPQTLAPPQ